MGEDINLFPYCLLAMPKRECVETVKEIEKSKTAGKNTLSKEASKEDGKKGKR